MKKIVIYFIVIVFMLYGCDNKRTIISEEFGEEIQSTESIISIETTSMPFIYVYICGQVKNPGVYALSSGSRVCDGIEAAGGILKSASVDNLNLASVLLDGEKIYVCSKEEAVTAMSEEAKKDSGLININKASKEELMTLPGIGETRADAIINYRDNNGSFDTIEDIMNINGIKKSVFDNIKALISVG